MQGNREKMIPPYDTRSIDRFFATKQANILLENSPEESERYPLLTTSKYSLYGEITAHYKNRNSHRIPKYLEPGNCYILGELQKAKFDHFAVNRSYFDNFLIRIDNEKGYYEILKDGSLKLYLDADYVAIHKISEYLHELGDRIKKAFSDTENEKIDNDQILFLRSTPNKFNADGSECASFHIIVNSAKCFKNVLHIRKFCEDNHLLENCENRPQLRLDYKVYKNHQKFRVLGSIKADRDNERRVLKFCDIDGQIEDDIQKSLDERNLKYTDTLVTYLGKPKDFYQIEGAKSLPETCNDPETLSDQEFTEILEILGFANLWRYSEEKNISHFGERNFHSEITVNVPNWRTNNEVTKIFNYMRMAEGDTPRMIKLGMMFLELMIQRNSNYGPLTFIGEDDDSDSFSSDPTNFQNLWFKAKSPKNLEKFYKFEMVKKYLVGASKKSTILNLETEDRTVIMDFYPIKNSDSYMTRHVEFNRINTVTAHIDKSGESDFLLHLMIALEGTSEILIKIYGIVSSDAEKVILTKNKIMQRKLCKSLIVTIPFNFVFGLGIDKNDENNFTSLEEGESVNTKNIIEHDTYFTLSSFRVEVMSCILHKDQD